MYKLVAVYKKPENPEAFDSHYNEVHLPICEKIPGLAETRMNKITGGPMGESDLYMIAELCFKTKDDFKTAMKSEAMAESGKDTMNFAKGIVSVHFAIEETK